MGKEGEAGNVQHCRCSLTPNTTDAAGRSQRVIGIGSKCSCFRGHAFGYAKPDRTRKGGVNAIYTNKRGFSAFIALKGIYY